jgi:hypothetical protein
MKNPKQKLKKILLLLTVLFTFSCSEVVYEENLNVDPETSVKTTKVSLNQVLIDLNNTAIKKNLNELIIVNSQINSANRVGNSEIYFTKKEKADVVNGVLYIIEGDKLNATLSAASAIPVYGWASTGAKYAIKIKNVNQTAYTVATKVKLVWKVVGNVIQFGSKSKLRKVLGMGASAIDPRQAHHIIPWNKQSKSIVQKPAKSQNAFHMNEALNGIPLSTAVHNGSHGNYDNVIQTKFDLFNASNPNATPNECYDFLTDLIQDVRNWIASHPNTPINNIVLP